MSKNSTKIKKLSKLRQGQEIDLEWLNTFVSTVNRLIDEFDAIEDNGTVATELNQKLKETLANFDQEYKEKLAMIPNLNDILSQYTGLYNTISFDDDISPANSPLYKRKNLSFIITDNITPYAAGSKAVYEKTLILELGSRTVEFQYIELSIGDATEFATAVSSYGRLFKIVDTAYVEATEFDPNEDAYYYKASYPQGKKVNVNRLWFYYKGALHNFSTDANGNALLQTMPIISINSSTYEWEIGGESTGVSALGIQGLTGARGPQGAQGPQGLKGDTGLQGAQGIPGRDGRTPKVLFCSADDQYGSNLVENRFINGKKYIGFKFVYTDDSDSTILSTPWYFVKVIGETYYPHLSADGSTLYFSTTPPTDAYTRGYSVKGEKGDKGDTGPAPTIRFEKDGNIIEPDVSTAEGVQTFHAGDFVGPKGEKGDTGPQGIQGEKGDVGSTPIAKAGGSSIIYDDNIVVPEIESHSYSGDTFGFTIKLPKPKEGGKVELLSSERKNDNILNYPYGYTRLSFRETKVDGITSTFNVDIPSGATGATPEMGVNGNWYLNGIDTGIPYNGLKGDTGDQGPAGPQGRGIANVTSAFDEDGNTLVTIVYSDATTSTFTVRKGSTGATGATGSKGNDGQSIQILGTVASYAALPNGITTGGGYIVQTDETHDNLAGVLYISKGDNTWIYAGQIKGPKGDTGASGTNGANGTDGKSIHYISSSKDTIIGWNSSLSGIGTTYKQGDLAISSDSWLLVAGASTWTAIQSIKGETGAAGSNGTNGAKGDQGTQIFSLTSAPTTSTLGRVGDFAYVPTTCNLYKCSAVNNNVYTWNLVSNLKGAAGDNGARGSQIFIYTANANTAPTGYVDSPAHNDLAINTADYKLYRYNDSINPAAWLQVGTSSLKGTAAPKIKSGGVQLVTYNGVNQVLKITLDDNTSFYGMSDDATPVPVSLRGDDGRSIIGIDNLSDTTSDGITYKNYRIKFTGYNDSDSTTYKDFSVAQGKNGANGQNGADGQQGQQGIPGTDGVDGADGKSIHYINQPKDTVTGWNSSQSGIGSTYQIDDLGITSDFYLVKAQTNKTWLSIGSLKGANGTNGSNGSQGPKGDKGDKGDTGAKGDPGDTKLPTPPTTSGLVPITNSSGEAEWKEIVSQVVTHKTISPFTLVNNYKGIKWATASGGGDCRNKTYTNSSSYAAFSNMSSASAEALVTKIGKRVEISLLVNAQLKSDDWWVQINLNTLTGYSINNILSAVVQGITYEASGFAPLYSVYPVRSSGILYYCVNQFPDAGTKLVGEAYLHIVATVA